MTVDEGRHDVDGQGSLPLVLHPDVAKVFRALENSGQPWLLLRGERDLARPSGDVDILVAKDLLPSLDRLMTGTGFRRVQAPGHGSHRFYFAYSIPDDLWLKMDVVSDIAFGRFQQWRTPLAAGCIGRRVRKGPFWLPAPADQAWLQLLHLVLDKGEILPERTKIARRAAWAASDEGPIPEFLNERLGPGTARQVLELLRAGTFEEVPFLAARMRSGWTRSRQARPLLLALVNRVRRLLVPRLQGRGPVVGVMAPDGAGKTTLLRALGAAFPVPSSYVYMGLWGASRWDPFLRRIPGGRVGKKVFRLVRGGLAARYHSLRGRLVLMDRVAYDAVLPGSADTSIIGRITNALAFLLAPDPDVLLVLDAPGRVMFARKGEHSVEILEERRQAYLQLADRLPNARVLDATQPRNMVQRTATEVIWREMQPGGTRTPEAAQSSPTGAEALNLHLWRLLDWRFLLPELQPRSLGYGGNVGEDLMAALRLLDPEAACIGTLPPARPGPRHQAKHRAGPGTGPESGPATGGAGSGGGEPGAGGRKAFDVVLLSSPDLHLLKKAADAVQPGGWVCAQVGRSFLHASGPRTLAGWRRAFERNGFADVAVYWHAPNLDRTARIVPVASRTAIRDTLSLQEAIPFRRPKVAVARLVLALHFFGSAIPEGTVLGRLREEEGSVELH